MFTRSLRALLIEQPDAWVAAQFMWAGLMVRLIANLAISMNILILPFSLPINPEMDSGNAVGRF